MLFFPDRLLAELVCGTVHLGNAGPAWGSVAWLAGRGVPLTLPERGTKEAREVSSPRLRRWPYGGHEVTGSAAHGITRGQWRHVHAAPATSGRCRAWHSFDPGDCSTR